MSTFLEHVPDDIREDWLAVLHRPGMNVLVAFLLSESESEERNLLKSSTDTMEKVCDARGAWRAYTTVTKFLKEQRRAAKSQTPAETEG